MNSLWILEDALAVADQKGSYESDTRRTDAAAEDIVIRQKVVRLRQVHDRPVPGPSELPR